MTDRYARLLARYALGVPAEALPRATAHEVKRRILDSLGVALAALTQDAPKAARAYACQWAGPAGATLWGLPLRATPEAASFANGVALRYLDYNDTYLSREPLHPSDMLPPLMALAEWRGLPPRELVSALAVAYEVGIALCDAASLRAHGWDHVNYIAIGTACGAGRLLGLSQEALEHAISIAVVPHASMRQTRAGELSMWKAAAAANSARNALFAALLAERGMTGPFHPFEGEMGFFRQVLGGEGFDPAPLRPLEALEPPTRILDTHIKFWPVEYHAQSAVDAALQLRAEVRSPGHIASVHIDTFRAAYDIIAKDPEKWEPQTRETADHSLPYIVVAALLDGEVSPRTFSPRRIADPALRRMLKERTTLREDPELTRGYPQGIPNRVTVRTTGGATLVREVRFPRGHARNPMSDREVEQKFRSAVEGLLTPSQAERVIQLVWSLEEAPSLAPLLEALRL